MREIGVHVRLTTTLDAVYTHAKELFLSALQCFFIQQENGQFYQPDAPEAQRCIAMNSTFQSRYLHGSYWINLAGAPIFKQRAFKREFQQAHALHFTHFILHPGSAKGAESRDAALHMLARSVDDIIQKKSGMQLLLENVAHGGMALGGDIQEFKRVKELSKHADAIKFCIDTAHAYSFGYDIKDPHEQEKFITLLDEMIGIASIGLIHLNDTSEQLGSKIDKHSFIGEGSIGLDALQRFVMHPRLKEVPIIMELPACDLDKEKSVLNLVRSWHE